MFIWVVIPAMSVVGGYWVKIRRQRKGVPSRALLSVALSHENLVQAGRPDVDAAVQLAAEITLSQPRKFRYNLGE